MTPVTAPARQVLTPADIAAMTPLSERTIQRRISEHGHIFGVAPIPDCGRRRLFSAVLINRALHGEQVPA